MLSEGSLRHQIDSTSRRNTYTATAMSGSSLHCPLWVNSGDPGPNCHCLLSVCGSMILIIISHANSLQSLGAEQVGIDSQRS